jgi:hypothetical protein
LLPVKTSGFAAVIIWTTPKVTEKSGPGDLRLLIEVKVLLQYTIAYLNARIKRPGGVV